MDASAEFVAFSSGDFKAFACAVAEFVAVGSPSGGSDVACGDDFVIFDDDGSVVAADAGGSFADDFSEIEVVVCFVPAFKYIFCFHDTVPLLLFSFRVLQNAECDFHHLGESSFTLFGGGFLEVEKEVGDG